MPELMWTPPLSSVVSVVHVRGLRVFAEDWVVVGGARCSHHTARPFTAGPKSCAPMSQSDLSAVWPSNHCLIMIPRRRRCSLSEPV